MGIGSEARRAAGQEAPEGPGPQDKEYIPAGPAWDSFERDAGAVLAGILGEDPGPAVRVEPNSWRMRNAFHQLPAELQRRRLCVFYPEGHEVVAARPQAVAAGLRFGYWAIRRSSNPMEEAMASPFSDLAGFGRAIA
jgi:hypothetical protein